MKTISIFIFIKNHFSKQLSNFPAECTKRAITRSSLKGADSMILFWDSQKSHSNTSVLTGWTLCIVLTILYYTSLWHTCSRCHSTAGSLWETPASRTKAREVFFIVELTNISFTKGTIDFWSWRLLGDKPKLPISGWGSKGLESCSILLTVHWWANEGRASTCTGFYV